MKRFKKISIKTISVFLAVIIAALSLPLNVMAEGLESLFNSLNTPEDVSVPKIFELKEARTASTKTFRLEDGSYYLAQYDSDVHYADENGQWQEIDNTLSKNGDEFTTNNEKIKFAKKTTGNSEIFTLHNGNKKLTLALDGAKKKVSGKITNNESELEEDATELQKMTVLSKISASIIYEDILDGVDLEYIINGSDIKENIIVKSRQADYAYSFILSLNNLYAELNSLGEVEIKDSDSEECVYLIPVPVMWDSAGAVSDNVAMSLANSGNGKYTLTISADSEWMDSEERVYPITIDPPLYTETNSAVTDIYVDSSNTVNTTTLKVSQSSYAYWKLGTLPALPTGAYVTNAEFSMESSVDEDTDAYIGVYGVTSDWNASLTWAQINATTAHSGKLADNYTDFQRIQYDREYGHTYCDGRYTWNVTPIVKNWYGGQNYGLAFAIAPETNVMGEPTFYSNEYAVEVERPKLCITYRDMKGLESYWSFTSQSAGFAGTSYINNATGALTFAIPTLTTTDALMPITPTLYYSAETGENVYSDGRFDDGPYLGSPYGYGFTLSICETVKPKTFTDESGEGVTYYLWQDSDGTEHYFVPVEGSSDTYEDEDGLLLKLETSASGDVTITDSNDTVRTFTQNGIYRYLTSIQDKNGNRVLITTNNVGIPTQIRLNPNESSEITQLTLNYSYDGALMNISNDIADEMIRFYYAESLSSDYLSDSMPGYLSKIEYVVYDEVVATAEYTYSSATELMTSAKNNLTGYKLSYSYDSAGRVTQVGESVTSGSATVQGQAVSISYGTSNTVIRTSGTDDTLNTSDDLLTTYSFDTNGRAVTSYTTDLEGKTLYGASNGEYVGEENEKAKNNLKSSVQTSQHSSNYLLNGGFEEWTGSAHPKWSVLGSVLDGFSYQGDHCASFRLSSTVSICQISQEVYLEEGEYTLAFYVNTYGAEGVTASASVNAMDICESKEIPVNEGFASGGYTLIEFSFTVNVPDYHTIIIQAHRQSSATLSDAISFEIDNVMLSKSGSGMEHDMVSAGHFESESSPNTYWTSFSGSSTVTVVDSGNTLFGDVLKIDKKISSLDLVRQTVFTRTEVECYDMRDEEVRMFTVSGWAKGTALAYNENSVFALIVEIHYYDGTTYGNTESHFFEFDRSITSWQFLSRGFTSNPDYGVIDSISVCIFYGQNPGAGYFDSISLVEDSSSTAISDYNQKGYISSYSNGKDAVYYNYDENNNVIYAVSRNKSIMQYEYDDLNRVTKEMSKKYVGYFRGFLVETGEPVFAIDETIIDLNETTYTYNDYGLVTSQCVSDGTLKIKSDYTFEVTSGSHIFGVMTTETNSLNETTEYFYDEINGRLMAVIYPNGYGITYMYDNMGNLTAALPAEATGVGEGYAAFLAGRGVTYAYDSVTKRLTSISTASTTYTFTYDVFGNASGINAGSHTLAEYTYNENNGKLNTLTYGNGLVVKYFYDSLDRMTEMQYNTGRGGTFETVYSYTYNGDGNLRSVTDHSSGEVTLYQYDSFGKLMQTVVYDGEQNVNLHGTALLYDEQSRLTSQWHNFDYVASGSVASAYMGYLFTYNNQGNLGRVTIHSDIVRGYITPTYDNLGRTSYKQITMNVSNVTRFYNKVTYDYVDNGSYTSGRISQYKSEVGISSSSTLTTTTYNYVYDSNGNITQIKNASGVIQNKYYYDDLGQLIREDNLAKNKTYTWEYDEAGNRTSEKTYAYTTGTLGTATSTKVFTYGDTTWGDLLTKVGTQTIQYDEIGNPVYIGYYDEALGYFTGGCYLTWEGRELISYEWFDGYEDGIDVYSGAYFTYNADGIRTSAEYDGTTHEYILDGSTIISETWDNVTFVYIYDENGSPIGIQYRTTSYAEGVFDCYFFEKNLQGDVIAIYNSNGTKVGTYTYDAWGNVTKKNLSTAFADMVVVNHNPFKYRSYYYDSFMECYYLQSRYYDPANGRFLNADGFALLGVGDEILGYNIYLYCANNPVYRIDPTGNAWWHWALGATVVIGCAVATVATAGGFAAAATAVGLVATGTAAATTASTVAASALIASSVALTTSAVVAASTSASLGDFAEQGNWGTVSVTVGAALTGGAAGYQSAQSVIPSSNYGYNLNGAKDSNYVSKRGWDAPKITTAIQNGKMGTAINKANNAACSVYCYPGTKDYVVIEDSTRTLVQASQFGDVGWIPDSSIKWE